MPSYFDLTLDTVGPVVSISAGPDVSTVSKVDGHDECAFGFQADEIFDEYKVKVVSASTDAEDDGVVIGTANGSSNMSGNAGSYPADTEIACVINGADLEAASSGDGSKVIKVFVKDQVGNWSVA